MTAFDRLDFSADNLFESLRAEPQSRADVASVPQAQYLSRYLTQKAAQTIIVEHDYVDGDYLDDYATYYAKSFTEYPRWCKRLHFFARAFTREQFRSALTAARSPAWLQESYLGFVVARPLPNAVVGRSVLATYESDNGRRHYEATRDYVVHLFGTPLTVRSLAFQQQDSVVAACATVALWSSFHATSPLFKTRLPTPAQITQSATGGLLDSRPLPSRGLRLDQMVRAVRELGLEPDVFRYTQRLPLLSLLAAYTTMGIPPILGVEIETHGDHAITVTGFSQRLAPVHAHEDLEAAQLPFPFRRIGLSIDELYVHDDGHGPFAKIEAHAHVPVGATDPVLTFTGTWKVKDGSRIAVLTPKFVLVPVHPKVRLSFMHAQEWVIFFAYVVAQAVADPDQLEWRLQLSTTNDLKKRLRVSALHPADVRRVLFSQQPRFVWSAQVKLGTQLLAEFLIDGTGIKDSLPALDVLFHEPQFRASVHQALTLPQLDQTIGGAMFEFLREKTR